MKVAYVFKVFGAPSCLMVAKWFDQVTFVFEECNNLLDSKSIFMICDFKIFPIMLLRRLSAFSIKFVTKEKLHFLLPVVLIVA